MKILSRYVFREIITSAFIGAVLATFVVFLQGPGRQLFELLVRSPANPETVLRLFVLTIPPILPLTVPFGVLVGILIGLGRLASDGEIIAMRAAGVPSRIVMPPVLVFAILATVVAAAMSLWLIPKSARSTVKVLNVLVGAQLTADVQARVFDEQFPNKVLYVADVKTGNQKYAVWRDVFLADITPAEQRQKSGTKMESEGPRITIAREAFAIPDLPHNRIQLNLRGASVHEIGKDVITGSHVAFPVGDQVLEAKPAEENTGKPFVRMDTPELMQVAKVTPPKQNESVESRIELHRRLALPIACLSLGLAGIPLGITTRKGGKSSGYIMAIVLGFLVYYLAYITLTKMAQQRTISPELAAWLPNAFFFVVGAVYVTRLEGAGDRDMIALGMSVIDRIVTFLKGLSGKRVPVASAVASRVRWIPSPNVVFQIVDGYILSNFLFYFAVVLVSLVSITEVYNFFELLNFIVKNAIPLTKVFSYLFFLGPNLIYAMTPVSVLVSVLITFGILTKQNEITAFKACGVSVHRLAVPVLVMSLALSAGLFAFDFYYIPDANLRQDALRAEIKGQPVQTYLRPDRKWIFGQDPVHPRFFYYRYFEPTEKAMLGVYVYEIKPSTFQLVREIGAERARWDASLNTWVFLNGWSRDVDGVVERNVQKFQATTFPELSERPEYFLKEVKQDKQMNYLQLANYVRDLQQSGFDTVKLRVQYHKKFSVPVFALIMAMLSIPFGFLVGNRGAMTGIGVSIAIAMAYWGSSQFFEQLGEVNLLPAGVAAWTPDALFALAGTYLLLRMRS